MAAQEESTVQLPDPETFPHLESPPIDEVVCGFGFEPIAAIDPFELGVYWDHRRADYPEKSIQPALSESLSINFGPYPPLRAWMVQANDGELLQQVQNDRFYLNWRRRKGEYPHFNDHAGGEGLLTIALREFERFAQFCEQRPTISVRPRVTHVELGKIDLLTRGIHWANLAELAEIMPATAVFTTVRQSERIQLALNEREQLLDGWRTVQIGTRVDDKGNLSAIRLEARISRELVAATPTAVFQEANASLNQLFFKLVPGATEFFGLKEINQ